MNKKRKNNDGKWKWKEGKIKKEQNLKKEERDKEEEKGNKEEKRVMNHDKKKKWRKENE